MRKYIIMCMILTTLLFHCRFKTGTSDILDNNLINAAIIATSNNAQTVALAGRIMQNDGAPIGNARISFRLSNSSSNSMASSAECLTDSNGFWQIDMSVTSTKITLIATVEKGGEEVATFQVIIRIERHGNIETVNVSTTVSTGDINASVTGYIRSSLLVSDNPASILEGSSVDVAIKFNQTLLEETSVLINSSNPAISVDGLSNSVINFEKDDSTVDQYFTLTANEDTNIISEKSIITISSEGNPDVVFNVTSMDNDIQNIIITGPTTMNEEGSEVLQIKLAQQPQEEIVIDISSENPGALSVNSSELTFTPLNYETEQAVTIQSIKDKNWSTERIGIVFENLELHTVYNLDITDNDTLFDAPVLIAANGLLNVAVSDFDGDGKTDIAATNGGNSTVSVYRNTASGGNISFSGSTDYSLDSSLAYGIAVGDFDGDGKNDIAITNKDKNSISILRNTGSPGVISFASRIDIVSSASPVDAAAADFDGDGKIDLAVSCLDDNIIAVYRNIGVPGTIGFDSPDNIATEERPANLALADFNNDGKTDFAVTYGFATYPGNSVFLNTGAPGSISFIRELDTNNVPGFGMAAGDLNGDGRADMISVAAAGSELALFENSGAGNISFTLTSLQSGMDGFLTPYYFNPITLVDFDSDGKMDLAFANGISKKLTVFRNNFILSGLSFSDSTDFSTGGVSKNIAAGDFNGDGKPDLVVANGSPENTIAVFKNILPD